MPYAPFGKSDRIGRAADFTAPLYFQNRNFRGRRGEEVQVNEQFQYKYDREDDAQFELVDTTKTSAGRGRFGGVRNRWQQGGRGRGGRDGGRGGRGQPDAKAVAPVQMRSIKDRARQQPQGKKKWNALRKNDRRPWHRRYQRNDRQASVKVQADWQVRL